MKYGYSFLLIIFRINICFLKSFIYFSFLSWHYDLSWLVFCLVAIEIECIQNLVFIFAFGLIEKGRKPIFLDALGQDVRSVHHFNMLTPRRWLCFHKWKVFMVAFANNGTLAALGREKWVGSWLAAQTDIETFLFPEAQ